MNVTAQSLAQRITNAIPVQLDRAAMSATYTPREFAMLESFMRKVTVRATGAREITLRCPAWRGSQWQARLTWLIDRGLEDLHDLQDTGHIRDLDATTTVFTW